MIGLQKNKSAHGVEAVLYNYQFQSQRTSTNGTPFINILNLCKNHSNMIYLNLLNKI